MVRRTLLARKLSEGAYDLLERRDGDRHQPMASALCHGAVFDHVVFGRHDALVVEGDTRRTYLPVGFAVPTGDTSRATAGACILLRPEAGLSEAYLRGWIHAIKGVLGDAIDGGRVTERAARAYFVERVGDFEATTEVIVV